MKHLDDWFPVGIESKRELSWLGAALGAALLYSMGFLGALYGAYQGLFYRPPLARTLIPGSVMPDFGALLGRGLSGFAAVALGMLFLAGYHYAYHFQGSRSIYLMRRLPQRRELLRRCAAAPALCAAAAVAMAVLALVLYYRLYLLVTPDACLIPGQWERLWPYLIGGMPYA